MTSKKQAGDQPASSLVGRYEELVKSGRIKDDPAQRQVLAALEALNCRLSQQPRRSLLNRVMGVRKADSSRGLYIWGNVGRGKSMLMDLFFEHVPVVNRRRVHFHAFMQEIHSHIHRLRQEGRGDPVAVLAQKIAAETTLLCFDELQATDVADATLLYRLFQGLFAGGVTIVSTSNHPPASLYTGGVQRERFAKFIALIEERMQVASLSSPLDYRHLQIKNLQRTYLCPLGAEADAFIAGALDRIGGNKPPRRETLTVQGRPLTFT
jgi:cell division protein ZapE